MAILTYGGVQLSVQKTHSIASEDEYDPSGLDYLWTRWTLDVTGLVNVAATSYTTQQGNAAPQAAPPAAANPPFLTIQAIRDTLALPRQPLTYADESGNVLIQSPGFAPVNVNGFAPGAGIIRNFVQPPQLLDCDCDGGPKPISPVQILGVHGQGKSVIVRFKVSTTVNDAPFWTAQGGLTLLGKAAPKPPVILSNRWSSTSVIDDHAFTTRTHAGRAVFRADLLRDIIVHPADGGPVRLAVPDDFRAYMMGHPIPPGFQRKQVVVEQEEDGFAVRYRVTDVQMPVTLLSDTACEIKVIQTESIGYYGHERLAEEMLDALSLKAASLAEAASIDPFHDAGLAASAVIRFNRLAAQSVARSVPRFSTNLSIEVSGQPDSTRKDLSSVAYDVLYQILTASDVFFSTSNISLTQDLMGKWVRLTCSVVRGPVASALVLVADKLVNRSAADLRGRFFDTDAIPGITTTTPGTQPALPNDSGTRGTALEALVAQTLMYPYNEAPSPPALTQSGQGLFPP